GGLGGMPAGEAAGVGLRPEGSWEIPRRGECPVPPLRPVATPPPCPALACRSIRPATVLRPTASELRPHSRDAWHLLGRHPALRVVVGLVAVELEDQVRPLERPSRGHRLDGASLARGFGRNQAQG